MFWNKNQTFYLSKCRLSFGVGGASSVGVGVTFPDRISSILFQLSALSCVVGVVSEVASLDVVTVASVDDLQDRLVEPKIPKRTIIRVRQPMLRSAETDVPLLERFLQRPSLRRCAGNRRNRLRNFRKLITLRFCYLLPFSPRTF